MTEQFLTWFRARTQREQYMVAGGAVAVALALLYFLIVPLNDALASAKARHADAVIALGETQARVDAVKALQADRAGPLDAPLESVIRTRANDAGFALTNVTPQGSDHVQLAIASARPGALIGWIAGLEASGILVDRLATIDNGDRTVSVQMTVKAQGQ
ncbi:type II secretion system protein GspM [Sphingomonas sp. MMS24-J45]|uniref:type II secretion system protein GspM n=1 Tax=Sphingomonas sp. MMS24-J45 TaxID=3238806 RepID=UPI0038510ABB